MTIIELIFSVAGGIAVIGSAVAVIFKFLSPTVKLHARVKALEESGKVNAETMEEVKNTNRLLCEGILSILENTITGNSVENLKSVRSKIQDFLIRK